MMTTIQTKTRIGFHYFPDTDHYTHMDLHRWLPRLTALNASWLTILAPIERAVPESFIRGLIEGGIQPVLQFIPDPHGLIKQQELFPIFKAYASWGVKYIAFYEKPNTRRAWPASGWSQNSLIERFLDRYIPIARMLVSFGLTPVFSPLEPGGEYWDTSFLRLALEALLRRKEEAILDEIVLGAYGYRRNPDWTWGAGGPERWPDTRPYFNPADKPDHRGFYIFDWYSAICEAVLGQRRPILLLRAGELTAPLVTQENNLSIDQFSAIYRMLANLDTKQATTEISGDVLGSCFWLLSTAASSRFSPAAIFQEDGSPNPAGKLLLNLGAVGSDHTQFGEFDDLKLSAFPIQQYVLLPKKAEPLPLQQIHSLPISKEIKYGTSVADATLAKKVIVLGGRDVYPSAQLSHLEKAGCEIIACQNPGIELAQILTAH